MTDSITFTRTIRGYDVRKEGHKIGSVWRGGTLPTRRKWYASCEPRRPFTSRRAAAAHLYENHVQLVELRAELDKLRDDRRKLEETISKARRATK